MYTITAENNVTGELVTVRVPAASAEEAWENYRKGWPAMLILSCVPD